MIDILTICVLINLCMLMNMRTLFLLLLLLPAIASRAQGGGSPKVIRPASSVASGANSTGNKHIITTTRRADGYIVYKDDTIKGLIMMGQNEVYLEHPISAGYSTFYSLRLKERELKTIMMYNADKKPLCLTRIKDGDKKMMRLIHEGKLNVYDDRVGYIYKPSDIDPFYIVVEHNGEVENLGSFGSEGTRKDLIAYINDIYGMQLPYKTGWDVLLRTMDGLD